jgi:hypothetical protein
MAVYGRSLPGANADGTAATPSRAGTYLEAVVQALSAKEHGFVAEGTYFNAFTPTSGTGIIGHAAPTTFDATKPYLLLHNGSATKTLYPQYITFNETVASAGGAVVRFVPVIDTVNRYASAGTALTITNCNAASTIATAVTTAFCGAVVASAAVGAKQYGDIVFRGTTIDIIGDNYTIVFGAPSSNGGASSKVATLIDSSRVAPPLAVGPGQCFLLHQWAASQSTGPTFQVNMGWTER